MTLLSRSPDQIPESKLRDVAAPIAGQNFFIEARGWKLKCPRASIEICTRIAGAFTIFAAMLRRASCTETCLAAALTHFAASSVHKENFVARNCKTAAARSGWHLIDAQNSPGHFHPRNASGARRCRNQNRESHGCPDWRAISCDHVRAPHAHVAAPSVCFPVRAIFIPPPENNMSFERKSHVAPRSTREWARIERAKVRTACLAADSLGVVADMANLVV